MPSIAVPSVNTIDNTNSKITLNYEDYGSGQPIVLIHGWPLHHASWEAHYAALVEAGYRVIAYDRRGFGNSDKPWDGYDYDTLATDLKGLIDTLDLTNVVIAGFSMGGGEVARYIGKFGTEKLAGAMLISAVTPFMLKTDDNPDGLEKDVFTEMQNGVTKDRFAFFTDFQKNFVNYEDNKETVSQEMLDFLWLMTTFATPKAMLDCITAFGTTDFRDDLKGFNIPTLIVHGADDQICPIDVCGKKAAELLPDARFEIIDGAPHGLNITHKQKLNDIMTNFLASNKPS